MVAYQEQSEACKSMRENIHGSIQIKVIIILLLIFFSSGLKLLLKHMYIGNLVRGKSKYLNSIVTIVTHIHKTILINTNTPWIAEIPLFLAPLSNLGHIITHCGKYV